MVGLSGTPHTPPSRGGRVNFFFSLVVDTRYPEVFVIVTLHRFSYPAFALAGLGLRASKFSAARVFIPVRPPHPLPSP